MEKKSNKNSLSLKATTRDASAALSNTAAAPLSPSAHSKSATSSSLYRSHHRSGKHQRCNPSGQTTPTRHKQLHDSKLQPIHNYQQHHTAANSHLSVQKKEEVSATSSNKVKRSATSDISNKHTSNSHNCNAMVAASTNNSVTTTPMTDLQTVVRGKASPARNKNEEAISDLLQRIPEIDKIFDVHSRIGNGTFSTVLLGTLKKERELPDSMRRKFAIKHHIPTSHPDRIMKELQCMANIGGTANVVGINCCIRYNESVAFIMPYMPHDRFHDFFKKMDIAEVQYYMKNLLMALKHVHKFNVIHRDVKPSNFLYNRRRRQFLLVDFGLAQQVPTQGTAICAANSLSINKNNVAGSTTTSLEGKCSRELDDVFNANCETTTSNAAIADAPCACASQSGSDVSVAKRLRCSGPQGDQEVTATPAASAAAVQNYNSFNGQSPFKMPLKQLNEIIKGSGTTCVASPTDEPTLGRQSKSGVLGVSLNNRLQYKLRTQQGQSTSAGLVPLAVQSTTTPNSIAVSAKHTTISTTGVATSKYNAIRNLSNTNSNCYCYGNPQVCNICLIKKEIHASRAGTPGYRPPEVLMKYPDQTTAVDLWAAGVIFVSILSSVYPFFKAPNDYVALAEMVTIFGDKTIRKTAFVLDRLVTLSQKTKPLDLRNLCVRFRNRTKFSSPELLKKYQRTDGTCEVCKNCDQFYFNCLCAESNFKTEPIDADDPFPVTAYDLLCRLLEVDPHKRITADEALNHPFFSTDAAHTVRNISTTPSNNVSSGQSNVVKKHRD